MGEMTGVPTDGSRVGELGAFLRARRERTAPRDVGLPGSGRRRTPGLRREEVATLAGVSVDYLVRLEQGRDVHPSAEVLLALADAMRMTDDERRHLFHLGVQSGNEAICSTVTGGDITDVVAPTVVALIGALDPTPAFVVAAGGDVLTWNDAWAAVAGALGLLDAAPAAVPNLPRFVFGHPSARTVFPEWRAIADEQVGRLRRAVATWPEDAGLRACVEELRQEPEFELRWRAHPVSEKRRGSKHLAHPLVGDLHVSVEVLDLADDGGQQVVSWLPADEATAARLAELTTPRLRLVEPG
jgi:transcriptional regulator with XRE-family HTH domain